MANSVSNDALWEKLSEISEQLNCIKQTESTSNFSGIKDGIIVEIKEECKLLGYHYDLNFRTSEQNWKKTNENITKILNIVSRIRKQQKETAEKQSETSIEERLKVLEIQSKYNREYFNFRFFKFRKLSLVIAVLVLLVLTLILFCMKQQNDYTVLNNEYYRKSTVIRELQTDSLKNIVEPDTKTNKKK